MTEVEFESEAFLKLLTDALRSGPASPEWREALRELRERGLEENDEYHLLVTAREHLESGKEYRSIKAGPEFTKNLMTELEKETIDSPARPQTSMLVAAGSAAAMLLVLLTIGYLLLHASDEAGGPRLLVNTVTTVETAGRDNPEWRKIGGLPLEMGRGGMRYTGGSDTPASGGGLVWDHPIPAGEPFAVQANVRLIRPEENLVAQVFVTDDPSFDQTNGTTSRELVWLLQSKQGQVILPTGRVATQSDISPDFRSSVTVRITIDGPDAIVEVNRQPWWKGKNLLDPQKPRYVGVRFLRRDMKAGDGIILNGIRVDMRQP